MKIYALIFIVSFMLLEAQVLSRTKVQMGTYVTISADANYSKEIEKGFDIFSVLNTSLSSYDKNAKVFLLNKNKKVQPDNHLYDALVLCKKYYQQSDGYFDITVGSVTKDLYRFAEDEQLPSPKKLQRAKVGFDAISFDRDEVFLPKGMKLDFGGMGKGFGVDKVAKYFKESNITTAIIAASGDIRCLGICTIEVQNPFAEIPLATFETTQPESSISTSGNYNRYVDSPKHNHLIDPNSKHSQKNFVSITLISTLPNSDLDAYATAASVMPLQKAYEFLEKIDLAYIILQNDNTLRVSDNLANYTKNLIILDTLKKEPNNIKDKSIK